MTTLLLFRIVAILEGISFLLLLGVAMPLKYMANEPLMVEIVGMAHGVLFILFSVLLVAVLIVWKLPVRVGVLGLVASMLPAGTFVFDRYLVRKVAQREPAQS